MRHRAIINMVLAVMVVCGGVAAFELVKTGSAVRSPAASAAEVLPTSPVPSPQPPPVPPPTPVVVPAAIPKTLTLQASGRELIKSISIDQNLLHFDGVKGGVVPGDLPGLYVADGVSTLPGTNQGTVIIGGHALASREMVFNPLMQLGRADLGHAQAVLELPGGKLSYTVEKIYIVDKLDLPQQQALADNRPGRLLLITCDVEHGDNTLQNLIVAACDESHPGCGAV